MSLRGTKQSRTLRIRYACDEIATLSLAMTYILALSNGIYGMALPAKTISDD